MRIFHRGAMLFGVAALAVVVGALGVGYLLLSSPAPIPSPPAQVKIGESMAPSAVDDDPSAPSSTSRTPSAPSAGTPGPVPGQVRPPQPQPQPQPQPRVEVVPPQPPVQQLPNGGAYDDDDDDDGDDDGDD